MPTIQTFDPLTAASDAVGQYTTAKREAAVQAAAQAQAQRAGDLEAQRIAAQTAATQAETANAQQRTALDREKFTYDQSRDAVGDAAAARVADRQDRAEAARELHEAAEDASKAAAAANAQHRDDRNYALQVAKINATAALETKKLAAAKTAEQLRSATSLAVANIHASTELEATGIREQGENARAGQREAGEDRRHRDTEAHADARAARGAKASSGADLGADIDALSPAGSALLSSFGDTNNPGTRVQSLLALRSIRQRGGSALTPGDYAHLERVLTNKDSTFVSSTHQDSAATSAERYDERGPIATAKVAAAAIMRTKQVRALPPTDQGVLEQVLGRFGASGAAGVLQPIVDGGQPVGGIDPQQAQRMLKAIGK